MCRKQDKGGIYLNRLGQFIQAALEVLISQLELPENWYYHIPNNKTACGTKRQREGLTSGKQDDED